MDTHDEGSVFLRYKTPAVFIRKYMSDELINLYEFLIKDKSPEHVIYSKYLIEIQLPHWKTSLRTVFILHFLQNLLIKLSLPTWIKREITKKTGINRFMKK